INNLPETYEFTLSSSIEQKQAKASFLYAVNDKHRIEAGGDFILYNISPGKREPSSPGSIINPLAIQKEQGREIAAYISDEISFTDKITLQAGLRYTTYDCLGPKSVYSYQAGVPRSKESLSDTMLYGKSRS